LQLESRVSGIFEGQAWRLLGPFSVPKKNVGLRSSEQEIQYRQFRIFRLWPVVAKVAASTKSEVASRASIARRRYIE
jgi:hypothetical protein